jgi:hypothetical protein
VSSGSFLTDGVGLKHFEEHDAGPGIVTVQIVGVTNLQLVVHQRLGKATACNWTQLSEIGSDRRLAKDRPLSWPRVARAGRQSSFRNRIARQLRRRDNGTMPVPPSTEISSMTDIEEIGPIDWLLIEFDKPLTGAAAPPLLDLVDRGLIRILDLLYIRKLPNGSVHAIDMSELPDDDARFLRDFDGATSGLLGEDDVGAAGDVLDADTRAVMLVYENRWAVPFAVAIREAGGTLVNQGRIPTQAIVAAIDELDEVDATS